MVRLMTSKKKKRKTRFEANMKCPTNRLNELSPPKKSKLPFEICHSEKLLIFLNGIFRTGALIFWVAIVRLAPPIG